MGILDGLTPIRDITPCRVTRLILELDTDDAQALQNALVDERWSSAGLSNALRKRGLTLAADTLRAHRETRCRCSRI